MSDTPATEETPGDWDWTAFDTQVVAMFKEQGPYETLARAARLGFFGSVTQDRIREDRRKRAMAAGLKVEFDDLLCQLAATASVIWRLRGTLTKEKGIWIARLLRDHPYEEEFCLLGEDLMSFEDDSEQQFTEKVRVHATGLVGQAVSLRNLHTPFLDSRIGDLAFYRPETQQVILRVRTEIGLANQMIDDNKWAFRLTFDPAITSNLRTDAITHCYNTIDQIAEVCERAAQRIQRLDLSIDTGPSAWS